MKVLVLLLCVLAYFFVQDLRIRSIQFFSRRRVRPYVDRQVGTIVRTLFALARFFVDLRVIRESRAEDSLPAQFLIVANHQSLLDIPVLIYAFPRYGLRFVGKKALFRYIVLVSILFRVQRHASIDRKKNFAETLKEIERLGLRARGAGFCPAVFPEGTRSRSGVIGPFHSGAVRTILRVSPLPVVAVALDGGHRASRLRQFVSNLKHLRYRTRIVGVFQAPKNKQEVDELLRQARVAISSQLGQWRARSTPSPAG